MGFDSVDLYEVFGLDPEGDTGEEESVNTQEAAAPAGDPVESDGANEQEAADPATDEEDEQEDTAVQPTADPQGQPPAGQTPEENAKYAAARRRAEMEAEAARAREVAQAREDERRQLTEEINRTLRDLGIKNPLKRGETIENLDQLREYSGQLSARQVAARMKTGDLTPEDLSQMVAQSAPMQQVSALTAELERQKQEAQRQQVELRLREDLQQIQTYDPTIQSIEDLAAAENYPQIREYVARGNSIADAYLLANRDSILSREREVASREAVRRAAGKEHLKGTKARGSGAVVVPEDMIRAYREFLPDATDAEIRAHYERDQKTVQRKNK